MTGPFFVVFGQPGEAARSRLGITATRKCGGSVERNRLKRVVREIYRRHPVRGIPPLDIVVNVKSGAASAPYARLESDLNLRFDELRRKLCG